MIFKLFDADNQFRLALLVENQQCLENMKIWFIEVKNKTNLIRNKTSTRLNKIFKLFDLDD